MAGRGRPAERPSKAVGLWQPVHYRYRAVAFGSSCTTYAGCAMAAVSVLLVVSRVFKNTAEAVGRLADANRTDAEAEAIRARTARKDGSQPCNRVAAAMVHVTDRLPDSEVSHALVEVAISD
ncbi:hypothetical protein GCM10009627_28690 [Curtobacterium herbarum]|uniref:Pilus assembly protein TadE n=1 Tax=Curtobacterium herbarum TaxID=150122 RepID=A0ABN1ZG97_9MICO